MKSLSLGSRRSTIQVLIASMLLGLINFIFPLSGAPITAHASAASSVSTYGTEFFVVFGSSGSTIDAKEIQLAATVSSTATLSWPDGTSTVVNIPQGQVVTVSATTKIAPHMAHDEATTNQSVRILSDNPISVFFGMGLKNSSGDHSIALPQASLGKDYVLMSYNGMLLSGESLNPNQEGSRFSRATIVATEPGTTSITITPSVNLENSRLAGVPFQVELAQGQVFSTRATHLYFANSSGQTYNSDQRLMDISGTRVTSDKKVGVLTSVWVRNIPSPTDFYQGYMWQAADAIFEQMIPVDAWGQTYVLPMSPATATGQKDMFRVFASQPNTVVEVNGVQKAVLGAGEWYEFDSTNSDPRVDVISASLPVGVMQYIRGEVDSFRVTSSDPVSNGDPAMVAIPPTDGFLDEYLIATPDMTPVPPQIAFNSVIMHSLTITAPMTATSSISLNGQVLSSAVFTPVPGSEFAFTRISVSPGVHSVSGSEPFGLTGIGTTYANSYAFSGGFSYVPNLNPVAVLGSPVTLPRSITLPLSCATACGSGDSFSYTASITAPGGQPVTYSGTSDVSSLNLTFPGLSANTSYVIQATVSYNGQDSQTSTLVVVTSKPIATISAITVLDTTATLTVGCTNCGSAPDSFTVSATPVAGGPAITSNTNQISGLSSETTYSFSVVVAFAGTTSDVVLWQSNPVMTLPFVPIISAVSPPAVPLTGGSITVAGSNFTTSTELTLDGATLSFTVVSGTQITFTAPSDTAGSYDLAITNPVGTYTLSNAITYVAGPTLVTNSPVLGTTNGGTIVTLTGTDLITTTQVNVGSTTVSFSVISNSVVRFVTAATSAGVVDVGVVTIGGAATLSSALEFTSSPLIPVVSSITPTSGPNSGGTLITVTGQYFSGSYSDSVSAAINGVSGSSVILIDDSTLTFVSPAGSAGAGLDVSVATGGGLGTLAGAFTYTAPPVPVTAGSSPAVVINTPTITEFSTREIPATGAEVTATGLRLENVSVLTLGGITVTMVSNTATSITFTTGEMPVGVWDLRLVAANGTLVFQKAIEVVEIQEITAQSSGELIGFAVTLRFTGNSRVLNDQQDGHLQRRLKSEADTIICWGYTTAQNPNSWALAHASSRAQAACNMALESMPGVSSIVRLRYGIPKDLAMRASVQFWRVVE